MSDSKHDFCQPERLTGCLPALGPALVAIEGDVLVAQEADPAVQEELPAGAPGGWESCAAISRAAPRCQCSPSRQRGKEALAPLRPKPGSWQPARPSSLKEVCWVINTRAEVFLQNEITRLAFCIVPRRCKSFKSCLYVALFL